MSEDGWGKSTREPNGQFPKGVSGNRRGRPRKLERAYTPTQVRHDILGLMEEAIEIKIMGKGFVAQLSLGDSLGESSALGGVYAQASLTEVSHDELERV